MIYLKNLSFKKRLNQLIKFRSSKINKQISFLNSIGDKKFGMQINPHKDYCLLVVMLQNWNTL